jgi:AraC-like DNA-binding protein
VASLNNLVPASVSGERCLERLSDMFQDLAERCPICRGHAHAVGRCRLLLCVQGEALASFSAKDWHQEMLLTSGYCCILYPPGRFHYLNCMLHAAAAHPGVNENPGSPAGHVPPETRKAVEKARAILRHRMAEPPPLEALAGEVSMSLSNLKLFFPKVVGLPPYAYLRRARMEQAHELLCRKRLSVTETALTVGYNSLSHFTKTFVAHFGVKPSRAAMQVPSRKGLAEFTGETDAFMS